MQTQSQEKSVGLAVLPPDSSAKKAKALAAELALLDQAFHECKQGRGEPLTDVINEPDDE